MRIWGLVLIKAPRFMHYLAIGSADLAGERKQIPKQTKEQQSNGEGINDPH